MLRTDLSRIPIRWGAVIIAVAVLSAAAVAAASHKVGGVDFDELTYERGPCGTYTSHMQLGKYTVAQEDNTYADVEAVIAGRLAGTPVAVVKLRCDAHAVIGTNEARAFTIAQGKARQAAVLGHYVIEGGEGFFHGPYPDEWIYVSFSGDKLYADVWQFDHRCDPQRDWLASTYAMHDATLVKVNALAHHRPGAPVPKKAAKDSKDPCSY